MVTLAGKAMPKGKGRAKAGVLLWRWGRPSTGWSFRLQHADRLLPRREAGKSRGHAGGDAGGDVMAITPGAGTHCELAHRGRRGALLLAYCSYRAAGGRIWDLARNHVERLVAPPSTENIESAKCAGKQFY